MISKEGEKAKQKEKREPGRRGGNLTLSQRRKELLSAYMITHRPSPATEKL
jgi:hypothetical protein